MWGLNIHKNSPVSVTKLMLGLRVGFISFHLSANKRFPVYPRVITGPPKLGFLLEAKNMPPLIIKTRLILVKYTDDLGWYRTSNKQWQRLVQNLNRIVSKPNVTPPQTVFQLNWCFRKTFLLTHKYGTAWAIEITAEREEWSELPIGATTATHTRWGHQSSGGQVHK